MEVEINGVKYRMRPSTTTSRGRSATISALAYIYASLAPYIPRQTSSKGQPPEFNLIDEVRLIQDKKSQLSRSHREYVMQQFNKHFEKI